jgi:hypothetical protein
LLRGLLIVAALAAGAQAQADVLWSQPLSAVDQNGYASQKFDNPPDGLSAFNIYLADDFSSSSAWSISSIFVPGTMWNGGTTLASASSLNFAIYASNGGLPAGYPGGVAAPQWSLSLAPGDGQIALSAGSDGLASNTKLTLSSPFELPAGDWWLTFYPDMTFQAGGQFGWQGSDTGKGSVAQIINPGGDFGLGTGWGDWSALGTSLYDLAFTLEGTDLAPPQLLTERVPLPGTLALLGAGFAGLGWQRRRRG